MIVADASAIGTFIIPDEAGPYADFARDVCRREKLHVPAHWHVELASLIRNATRRGRLTVAQCERACRNADVLAAGAVVAPVPAIGTLVPAAADLGLTAYDAAYLLLARALAVPLLTEDGALGRAAALHGIEVLQP